MAVRNHSVRMMLKISQIARLRLALIKDVIIARHLGITHSTLVRIIRTSDYQEYEQSLLQGHLSKMDEKLAGRADLIQKEARQAVPMALRTVIEVAMQRKDLKSALAASKELLQMDPDRTLVDAKTEAMQPATGLPQALFEALVKDSDGVAASINTKLNEAVKTVN